MGELDAIVVGLGGMGSAVLGHLAGRGLRALGLEQHHIGHQLGSSHGLSRVIRKAYSEHPGYVPLLHRAYQLWADLEETTGASIATITGAVHIGPADHAGVLGVIEAVETHGLAHERLTAADVRRRYPALVPAQDDVAVFEPDAGVLAVERAVAAQVERAVALGADVRLGVRVTDIASTAVAVTVKTSDGATLTAANAVVCAGPWLAGLIDPGMPLQVTRQVQCWFAPRSPDLFSPGQLPVFVHFVGDDAYYGIPPGPTHAGVKVCRHHGGEVTTAEAVDREVRDADEEEVRAYLRRHLPAADGPMVTAQVCMYTSTPDHHFAIGRAPGLDRVFVAGGFSGHGFKLAPVVGEIIADLVTEGATRHDISLFDPDRYA